MSAFDVMMNSSKRKADEIDDDRVIGIGYEAKLCGEGVDPGDPLYGTCYYGIAVRPGYSSPEALRAERQREHERAAKSKPKDLGIRAIIARYGRESLVWSIVESKVGDRVFMQKWANDWEQSAIAAAGGVLRDIEPGHPIRQTFNLTSGGVWGDPEARWAGIEAKCNASWKKFQHMIQIYVDEHNSARVPTDFVNAEGYRLGQTVHSVRQGDMIRGRKDESVRREYLEALPKWTWNVNDSAWEKFKAALQEYVALHNTARVPARYRDADGYRLGETLGNVRSQGYYLSGKVEEVERRAWLEALPGWAWDGNDAGWECFKKALCKHVRKTRTSYVPQTYTDEDGFPLGKTLQGVRKGLYLCKRADESARRTWLENLPGWVWVSTEAIGASNTVFELALLRSTTHPHAKRKDVKQLRNAHGVIRAHEVMRDRAIASIVQDLVENEIMQVTQGVVVES